MPPKTTKQRSREYRNNMKADPVKYQEHLKKDRERYLKKKEKGVVKSISDIPTRAQRLKRRQWKTNQRNRRIKIQRTVAMETYLSGSTPPQSPDALQPEHEANLPAPNESPPDRPSSSAAGLRTRRQNGRKKVGRTRSKTYRDLCVSNAKLDNALRSVEKYRKRYDRLLKKIHKLDSPNAKTKCQMATQKNLRRTLLFHNAIMSELREKYQTQRCAKDRQVISKILAGKILKKYRLVKVAQREFGFSPKAMRANEKRPTSLQYTRKKQCNRISKASDEKIKGFLERDDNSRATTGKKETRTRNKKKMQKRFLNEPMQKLHQKFRREYPEVKISYNEFCKRRPFWVVKPTVKDRDTR